MSFSKYSTKLNAVAFLLMALLAACLLSPFCLIPSAPSAVISNNVAASSCVLPASPFFDRKICPLEEEAYNMIDYHYVIALETTTSLPISWLSKISSFLHLHRATVATSTAWLLDMQMMISRYLFTTAIDLIENVGGYRRSWGFNYLKVNFVKYADYWSAVMMSTIDHALVFLQKAFHELYSTLTSFYSDLPAWRLHLPTGILRGIPTALSSVQPYLVDLLINSTGLVNTAAARINVTTTTDGRKALYVASGLVGVDKSVLVPSPGFFVLHPPMFLTIVITLDSVMAPGGRNYTLVVNFDLVAIAIALLSMLAVRVLFSRVVEGFKTRFLHLTNWNGSIFFYSIISLPASAYHRESCESPLSLGSASGADKKTKQVHSRLMLRLRFRPAGARKARWLRSLGEVPADQAKLEPDILYWLFSPYWF